MKTSAIQILLSSACSVLLLSTAAAAQSCPATVTDSDMLGPFYVTPPNTDRLAPEEQLSDPNRRLVVSGTVYGQDCVPMADVHVEPWYAGLPDGNGDKYSKAGSALDYRGSVVTDGCGNYEYTATFPEIYPQRPIRHIHYRLSDSVDGRELLVTQQYFEGHIPDRFGNLDGTKITSLTRDDDGTRRTTFDIHLDEIGTADPTACGGNNDDGYFQLKSKFHFNDEFCLEVKGGSTSNFTPMQMSECSDGDAQRFRFDGDGRLRTKLSSDACVEMDPRYGVFIHSACIDEWEIDTSSPYGPFVKNVGDGKCIAVDWSSFGQPSDGDPVIGETCGDFNSNAGFEVVH